MFDVKEHHKLLHDSLSYFETHFSTTIAGGKEDQLPESLDLIKRMSAIVTATSKLNAGLRNLVAAVNDAHVEAQLDESQTGSSVSGLVAFEKNTNQLLRISDDQVRSITEGLIAFTRADRERQRLMKDSTLVGTPGSASRPTSRTGSAGYRSITPSSPQKTPFVSPSPAQEVFTFPSTNKTGHHPRPSSTKPAPPLRDPLEGLDRDDPSPSLSRATSVGARMLKRYSPILGTGPADSPTPAGGFGRSDSLHVRSPLSHSRNGSMEDPDLVRPIVRRAKTSSTSATTVRGAVNQSAPPHLLRSPQTADPATINENADTTRSPTRDMDHSGMTRSRTVSDAAAALEPVVEQQDFEKDMVSRRHTLSAGTARSLAFLQNDEEAIPVTPVGKEPRKRMSTGAGAASALRQGLSGLMSGRRRGNTIDRENAAEVVSSPFHAASSSIATSTPSLAQRSAERRKEVEAILRRTVGRSSIS
ncbi:hypothetical protein BT69DRAFT_258347 [Atractiella rhizophila]|nr:hypothetical protein BT69DRAFT_258347 [Atractiella rhizophila]